MKTRSKRTAFSSAVDCFKVILKKRKYNIKKPDVDIIQQFKRKRGRPRKVLLDGVNKKRGRPRDGLPGVVIKKRRRPRNVFPGVVIKKRGRARNVLPAIDIIEQYKKRKRGHSRKVKLSEDLFSRVSDSDCLCAFCKFRPRQIKSENVYHLRLSSNEKVELFRKYLLDLGYKCQDEDDDKHCVECGRVMEYVLELHEEIVRAIRSILLLDNDNHNREEGVENSQESGEIETLPIVIKEEDIEDSSSYQSYQDIGDDVVTPQALSMPAPAPVSPEPEMEFNATAMTTTTVNENDPKTNATVVTTPSQTPLFVLPILMMSDGLASFSSKRIENINMNGLIKRIQPAINNIVGDVTKGNMNNCPQLKRPEEQDCLGDEDDSMNIEITSVTGSGPDFSVVDPPSNNDDNEDNSLGIKITSVTGSAVPLPDKLIESNEGEKRNSLHDHEGSQDILRREDNSGLPLTRVAVDGIFVWRCDKCGLKFGQNKNLATSHCHLLHGNGTNELTECPICFAKLFHPRDLDIHIKWNHPTLLEGENNLRRPTTKPSTGNETSLRVYKQLESESMRKMGDKLCERSTGEEQRTIAENQCGEHLKRTTLTTSKVVVASGKSIGGGESTTVIPNTNVKSLALFHKTPIAVTVPKPDSALQKRNSESVTAVEIGTAAKNVVASKIVAVVKDVTAAKNVNASSTNVSAFKKYATAAAQIFSASKNAKEATAVKNAVSKNKNDTPNKVTFPNGDQVIINQPLAKSVYIRASQPTQPKGVFLPPMDPLSSGLFTTIGTNPPTYVFGPFRQQGRRGPLIRTALHSQSSNPASTSQQTSSLSSPSDKPVTVYLYNHDSNNPVADSKTHLGKASTTLPKGISSTDDVSNPTVSQEEHKAATSLYKNYKKINIRKVIQNRKDPPQPVRNEDVPCKICNALVKHWYLEVHQRLLHPETMTGTGISFACPKKGCGQRFTTKDAAHRHIVLHHE